MREGRPKELKEGKAVSVYLDAITVKKLKEIGTYHSLSSTIRKAIDQYVNSM